MKSKKPLFFKSMLGLLFVMILGIGVYLRANKKRTAFQKVYGTLTFINSTNKYFPNKDTAKYRYLKLDNFNKTFELFIGKESGDFKPKLEQIDRLVPGDSVTIFYDENYNTEGDSINRLAYFIDKGTEVIFIKGNGEKNLAIFLICISVIIFLILVKLRKLGKII